MNTNGRHQGTCRTDMEGEEDRNQLTVRGGKQYEQVR